MTNTRSVSPDGPMRLHLLLPLLAVSALGCALDPAAESSAEPTGQQTPALVASTSFRTRLCRPGLILPQRAQAAFADERSTPVEPAPYTFARFAVTPAVRFGYNPRFNPSLGAVGATALPRSGLGELNFSPNRRPIIRDNNLRMRVLEDNGDWALIDLEDIIDRWAKAVGLVWDHTFGSQYSVDRRVVVTNDCHLYTVASLTRSNLRASLLLHSKDGGATWEVIAFPAPDNLFFMRLEFPSNGAIDSRPPVVLASEIDGGYRRATARAHDLTMYVPSLAPDGSLVLGPPQVVATDSLLGPYQAAAAQVVSAGEKITVFYPTTTVGVTAIPGLCGAPQCYGTAQVARTYDRATKTFGPTIPLGAAGSPRAAPTVEVDGGLLDVTDSHDQPTAAVDSAGYLHVVLGAHAGALQYVKSLKPQTANGGFTPPTTVAFDPQNPLSAQYTYPTMVIDSQDTLHLVARASYGFRLHYLRRSKADTDFSSPLLNRALLDPVGDHSGGNVAYGHYNQKFSIDPWGRLWLAVNYLPGSLSPQQAELYRQVHGLQRMTRTPKTCRADADLCDYDEVIERNPELYVSTNGGSTWSLATTADFYR
jgi:BNR repeat-containing family member